MLHYIYNAPLPTLRICFARNGRIQENTKSHPGFRDTSSWIISSMTMSRAFAFSRQRLYSFRTSTRRSAQKRTKREVNHRCTSSPFSRFFFLLSTSKHSRIFPTSFPFPRIFNAMRESNERKSYEKPPVICLNAFAFRDNDRKEIIKLYLSVFFQIR